MKTWTFARKLIERAHRRKLRILGTREMQNSIKDSVHRVLSDQILNLGLSEYFRITEKAITHHLTGSEFIFKGLHHHPEEIKSLEGIDIAWVAEAQNTSFQSWKVLIPTIRKPNSEIWIEFNTNLEEDETYKRFITNRPPNSIIHLVNYYDNPYFPAVLEEERAYSESLIHSADNDDLKDQARADYENIWLGAPSKITQSAIFRNRVKVHEFDEPPHGTRFYFGADFGFSKDPSTLLRSFITGEGNEQELWIDYEAYGYGVEIDELYRLYDKIPGAREWPIKGDAARPETISYMRRQGFTIDAAEKWQGSVEDGIAHLKGFKLIHIHMRCPKIAQESRMYSYKVDKVTGDILPIIVDAWNHGWDGVRYSLDGFIMKRGGLSNWEKLGEDYNG